MKLDEIRELMLLMDQSSISELEVQNDNYRLSLRKGNGSAVDKAAAAAPVNLPPALSSERVGLERDNITEVLAPMVGTFYAAPSPDSPPYVQPGEHVGPGQTLCILEAMKLMNEIKTEFAGTIIEIMVDNAEAVEYGQVLFLIEKD
ncbi:MAG TPA: acetyl-CoA carboxylase biotin carboxyl carrier protein [Syntrophomonas wolfei]|uniref:Biotin carboxyl carrier protein of acetyl-CoA carboxylase n=3 Tax=Syntrophomonas wolfei TaxID=863 RepID=A0A354YY35_9FIRM|nr:acetyl-CoA carboxylase biotin carboxyl carrier protein [Syntrophomonas wolfei]